MSRCADSTIRAARKQAATSIGSAAAAGLNVSLLVEGRIGAARPAFDDRPRTSDGVAVVRDGGIALTHAAASTIEDAISTQARRRPGLRSTPAASRIAKPDRALVTPTSCTATRGHRRKIADMPTPRAPRPSSACCSRLRLRRLPRTEAAGQVKCRITDVRASARGYSNYSNGSREKPRPGSASKTTRLERGLRSARRDAGAIADRLGAFERAGAELTGFQFRRAGRWSASPRR